MSQEGGLVYVCRLTLNASLHIVETTVTFVSDVPFQQTTMRESIFLTTPYIFTLILCHCVIG
jgi:hypothetical protein